jgi:hypothetical protein
MNDGMQGHHAQGGSGMESGPGDHRPYWKRAHQDWRVWVAVVVMIAGMVIYVMSDDFAFLPRSASRQPVSGVLGN